jgi:hypothetical protein
MNILKLLTPASMHDSISFNDWSLTSETIMWKP